MNEPLVSVIMPLYNAEKYVGAAIESVTNQSYTNWELIIVNDGSTDNSLEVAKKFENEKIKVFSQENKGASAARNYGYSLSKGEYIKFFDADDLISSEMISSQVELALANPNAIISAKWGRFYNDDLTTFKFSPEECWQDMYPVEWITKSWYKGTSMTQPGIFLIPKNTIEKQGLWDETLSLVDDLEFYTKTILGSQKVIFSEKSILLYRSGNENNLSGSKSRKAMESCYKAMDLSTRYLLKVSNDYLTINTVANLWQSFVYECYPNNLDLIKLAEFEIKKNASPTIQYTQNKLHKSLIFFIGWKNFKKIIIIKKRWRKYY